MKLTDADRAAWADYEAANKRAADAYNPNGFTPWWTKRACPQCGIEHAGVVDVCHKCRREGQ